MDSILDIDEVQSKFEQKGKIFTLALAKMLQSGDTNGSTIYRYQIEAVLNTHAFLMKESGESTPRPVLIVAPTGSGKSGMIAMLPYVLQSRRVLVLTPSVVISEQLGRAFGIYMDKPSFFEVAKIFQKGPKLDSFLETGMIIKDCTDVQKRPLNLVIANAQKFGGKSKMTLNMKYKNDEVVKDVKDFFSKFDTLIVDEAHHFPAPTWKLICEQFQIPVVGMQKKIIFVTATPYRNQNGNLVPILERQRVSFQMTPEDIQATKGKTIRKTEFQEKRGSMESSPWLAKDIKKLFVKNLVREPRIEKPQAIILVRTMKDAEDCAKDLNAATGDSNFAIAITSRGLGPQTRKNFTDGNHQVAVTCGLLSEGYDNSNVIACIILRKVKSKIVFSQFIGRCARMRKFAEGEPLDRSVGHVLSYKEFNQRQMWEEQDHLAVEDPSDEEEEGEVSSDNSSSDFWTSEDCWTSEEGRLSYGHSDRSKQLRLKNILRRVRSSD